jgi:hypothetical protein
VTQPGDPFQQQPADPFGAPTGPPTVSYAHPAAELWQFAPASASPKPPSPPYNTLAVLSPILAIPVPPAGVVLGHLALPQIRRTGERDMVRVNQPHPLDTGRADDRAVAGDTVYVGGDIDRRAVDHAAYQTRFDPGNRRHLRGDPNTRRRRR